ncbi:MAG: rod shape-determining protein MreD [Gammaproteobacteria bacterium CG_4_10_14_0_8_um_filter_38_16]|nr:MAG: rod shape-determining protein MreD [Gammaproteobacteria bacterium CG_4_10_14_0_8_um_filter_38_16]PJA03339.1 MAG: rod shape-determining protein MreD [Gammaproteobacteria bacterium CG_4_10_14_0_2_um_filter_38_22]PJB10654.1 MAG: rod shape-determining protein MreD [Gammaproteobacteria bacterium CG_4_9_14_3_um_filter_38_9]
MKTNYFFIGFTFLVAIVLTIIPLPQWAIWLRPQWILSVLLFWVIVSPEQCGVGFAWTIGIVMDLIIGTPIGQQSLVFVFLTYILLKFHAVVFHSPRWQQALFLGFFAIFNVILRSLILGFTGHSTHVELNGLSVFTTIVIWPWLYDLIDVTRPKTQKIS